MNQVREIIGCYAEECMQYIGRNICTAVLDTGIYPHEDIRDRIVAFYDTINQEREPYDDNGHGTHICGIIGGDGSASGGRYQGVAPGAGMIGVKILDHKGNGMVYNLEKGVDWVLENRIQYGIRIANISIGMFPKVGSEDRNIIIKSVEKLWDMGIVVVAAAGNNGPRPGTITYPGISRKIITVGTTQNRYAQKSYSGRGPTPFCIMKPEVVAPGAKIVSCRNIKGGYAEKSGTSMATPVVSGAICRLLEKYPGLEPVEVKMRIHDSAKDLGLPKNIQGWGQIWLPDLLR